MNFTIYALPKPRYNPIVEPRKDLVMLTPKNQIIELLTAGDALATQAEGEKNVHACETLARQAVGYFQAAAVLLGAFGELHNELIEHPLALRGRKFCRTFRF